MNAQEAYQKSIDAKEINIAIADLVINYIYDIIEVAASLGHMDSYINVSNSDYKGWYFKYYLNDDIMKIVVENLIKEGYFAKYNLDNNVECYYINVSWDKNEN